MVNDDGYYECFMMVNHVAFVWGVSICMGGPQTRRRVFVNGNLSSRNGRCFCWVPPFVETSIFIPQSPKMMGWIHFISLVLTHTNFQQGEAQSGREKHPRLNLAGCNMLGAVMTGWPKHRAEVLSSALIVLSSGSTFAVSIIQIIQMRME